MAKLTWKKEINGYEVDLSFICHYKKGFIIEFDSHDMTDNIDNVFEEMRKNDYQKLTKMGFLELSAYLFNKIPNLYSVEFIDNKSSSEYFIEDIKEGTI